MDGISGIGSSDKKIGASQTSQTQSSSSIQGVDGQQNDQQNSTGASQQANKAFGSKDI